MGGQVVGFGRPFADFDLQLGLFFGRLIDEDAGVGQFGFVETLEAGDFAGGVFFYLLNFDLSVWMRLGG